MKVAKLAGRVLRMPTAGYFVLGDNLPLSFDSRDADFGRIDRNQILGRLTSQTQEE